MTRKVVLDACVLVPYHLCDLLLYLAEDDLLTPVWSEEILDEVERNLSPRGITAAKAARRVGRMRAAFPFASVSGFEDLTATMTNHPKDRHVLAAAVHAGADVVVTANLKDFPIAATAPHGVTAVHPDVFLSDLLENEPERVIRCAASQREDYSRPALTFVEFYGSLQKTVPNFAAAAADAETSRVDRFAPLPLEVVSDEAAAAAFFPDGPPSPETPLGAAYLWWSAVTHLGTYDTALERLSYQPSDWGDYRETAEALEGWSLMQTVHRCEDAPEDIAYVKLMPDTGHAMRAFSSAPLVDFQIITVVRCPDGWWRVWGHSHRYIPPANRILSR